MTQLPALHQLKVLDLSRVLAGPLAAQILADLGADVVKIERPGKGDDTREWAPPFLPSNSNEPLENSAYFWACNRGKKSLTANISTK
jgi:crotonobetainyl-CoA:carnitine CoA-transferase CaiB-like acyl-CoA transferase